MRKYQVIAVSLFLLFLISGCSVDYKCKIKSNTSWKGLFPTDSYIDDSCMMIESIGYVYLLYGRGDTIIDIPDDSSVCITVCKTTDEGFLEIQIIAEGCWFLNHASDNNPVRINEGRSFVRDCIISNEEMNKIICQTMEIRKLENDLANGSIKLYEFRLKLQNIENEFNKGYKTNN